MPKPKRYAVAYSTLQLGL